MKKWQPSIGAATIVVAVVAGATPLWAAAFSLEELQKAAQKAVGNDAGASAIIRVIPKKERSNTTKPQHVTPNGVVGSDLPARMDGLNQGFPSDFTEGAIPKGEIVILDAAEVVKRAGQDMATMRHKSEETVNALMACQNKGPADDRNEDPMVRARRMTVCLQAAPEDDTKLGIYRLDKEVVRVNDFLDYAAQALEPNADLCPTAGKARRGVVTAYVGLHQTYGYDEFPNLLWVTLVDTRYVGTKDGEVKLPPGAKITSYDAYVEGLKRLANK